MTTEYPQAKPRWWHRLRTAYFWAIDPVNMKFITKLLKVLWPLIFGDQHHDGTDLPHH